MDSIMLEDCLLGNKVIYQWAISPLCVVCVLVKGGAIAGVL